MRKLIAALIGTCVALTASAAFLMVDGHRGQAPPAPGGGDAPEYISGLADFNLVELAPSSTMASITPAGHSGSTAGVIAAWSGGAKGAGYRLFVHGGGHGDSSNNGLYIFDYRGTTEPAGWATPLEISDASDIVADSCIYSDDRPTASHTYDGQFYARGVNAVYRFAGTVWQEANFADCAWKYDLGTGEWSQLTDFPGGSGGAVSFYDEASGKAFVVNATELDGYFFDTTTDTWAGASDTVSGGLQETGCGYDDSRTRGVCVGGNSLRVITFDWSAETVSVATGSMTGDTDIVGGKISTVYDPELDLFWLLGGGAGSAGWSNIYEMNADGTASSQRTLIEHALSGTVEQDGGMQGSYGRWARLEGEDETPWRAIGTIADVDTGAYLIKLPEVP